MVEYPLVVRLLRIEEGMPLLDIGSSAWEAFPLLLAEKGCLVTATNIDPVIHTLTAIAPRIGVADRLRAAVVDGRHLPYKNCSFERITSVSVLEHIQNDGDSAVMAEIGRVLRPGGRAIVTVPFAEQFMGTDPSRPYFMRVYDLEALNRRLVAPSRLTLEEVEYFGDRFFAIESPWVKITGKLRPFCDWLTPLVAGTFCSTLPVTRVKRVGGACLALVKQ